MNRLAAEYILPLRWADDTGAAELTAYLHEASRWIDVSVVDGSEAPLFQAHAEAWSGIVRHLPVAVTTGANGKVRGVLTGLAVARHERVVIADDDVRYDRRALATVVGSLDDADLVVPQNHFAPVPWHGRWDTARTLLNRALAADYPGTYGARRSILLPTGGYDADVLFENLEMQRTVEAAGGRTRRRDDVFVRRRPPTTRHFLGQRVRQAYDSLAQPARLVLELAILPATLLALRRPGILAAGAMALVATAERGRRVRGGRRIWPATSALWAPLWALERGTTAWLAVALRVRGGVRYAGTRVARAATPRRQLRRRYAGLRAPARP